MDNQAVILHARRIINEAKRSLEPIERHKEGSRIIGTTDPNQNPVSHFVEALEFLRLYAGERSAFYKTLASHKYGGNNYRLVTEIEASLKGFVRFIENGLLDGLAIERKAQIDVVSDFLSQAQELLNSKGVHPAAPAMIVGASLEEFLRNWVEDATLSISNKKPSIDAYASTLREAEVITKQDMKDITAWAGKRNDAAHGNWDAVKDKASISNMLDGVNLFIRKYTNQSSTT